MLVEDADEEEAAPPAAIPPPEDPFHPHHWLNVELQHQGRRQTRAGMQHYTSFDPPGRGTEGGAKNIPMGTHTPSQYLELLWTNEIVDTFVEQTNLYAQHQDRPSWSPENGVTREELKKFIGITLYMGISQLPSRRMYWESGIYGSAFVQKSMSRNRFMAINANLHWLDLSYMSDAERIQRNRADGYWTLETFFSMLANNYQTYYQCGRYLSIDEMCIFFKGRHRCRCYNPNKPNKWHLKAYCLNDASTGYLFNYFMYRGKDEHRDVNHPRTNKYPYLQQRHGRNR